VSDVLLDPLPSTERVLFQSALAVVGQVRCPPAAAHFRDCGSNRTYCAAFSRSAVGIRRRDHPPFIEEPTVVGLYNRGDEYERFEVSPEGDRADWFAFSPAVIRDAIRSVDPAAADEARPIRKPWARVSPRTFLRQRTIFEHVRRTPSPDAVLVDEWCVQLLDAIVREVYGAGDAPRVTARGYELAEAARTMIQRRFADPLSLSGIASSVDASPFHLCRTFRRVHRTSIHRYLTRVRLRRAVECLGRRDVDLGRLAVELGFSSHSHFSAAFRGEFGVSPSAVRAGF
jgi:AraC family transcriptional regulator